MDQRAHFITVATPDLDAARRFYVEGLRWSPLLDVPGEIIFFQIGPGLTLGLFEAQHFVDDLALPHERADQRAPAGLTLSHNVESPAQVRTMLDAAVSAGATMLKPPQTTSFGGFHGHFVDPNGLIWEICHNPGWSVRADGVVSLG